MVKSFGVAAPQPMLDDQKANMHITPLNGAGAQTSLPTGPAVPTYTPSDPTLCTLQPAADGLSCFVLGVKGKAGNVIVTASYTNPDNTVVTGTGEFDITLDPAELDVASLDVTIDPPVAQ